jgi:hypothetical protein
LINQMMTHMRADHSTLLRWPLTLLRKIYKRVGVPISNSFANLFPELGVVPAESKENLYAGVAVIARKK